MSRYLSHKYRPFPSFRLRTYIHFLNDFAFVMQQFQTYPLSILRRNDLIPVVDDNNTKKYLSHNISRFTSNDSGISYDDSDDSESLFSNEYDFDFIDPNYPSTITITNDGNQQSFFLTNILFIFFSSYGISNT